MKKKPGVLLATFLLVVTLFGCFGSAKEKTFTTSGMEITLTEAFGEKEYIGYTSAYSSQDIIIFTLKESFTLLAGSENYTLSEYGEIVIRQNDSKNPTDLYTEDGLSWFEYSFYNPDFGQTYYYYCYVFKAKDAFWLIQFATFESKKEDNKATIVKYAKSIQFAE